MIELESILYTMGECLELIYLESTAQVNRKRSYGE